MLVNNNSKEIGVILCNPNFYATEFNGLEEDLNITEVFLTTYSW